MFPGLALLRVAMLSVYMKVGMERWWNDTDRGNRSTGTVPLDTDRGMSMEHWWN